jgi:hypothetical protein
MRIIHLQNCGFKQVIDLESYRLPKQIGSLVPGESTKHVLHWGLSLQCSWSLLWQLVSQQETGFDWVSIDAGLWEGNDGYLSDFNVEKSLTPSYSSQKDICTPPLFNIMMHIKSISHIIFALHIVFNGKRLNDKYLIIPRSNTWLRCMGDCRCLLGTVCHFSPPLSFIPDFLFNKAESHLHS